MPLLKMCINYSYWGILMPQWPSAALASATLPVLPCWLLHPDLSPDVRFAKILCKNTCISKKHSTKSLTVPCNPMRSSKWTIFFATWQQPIRQQWRWPRSTTKDSTLEEKRKWMVWSSLYYYSWAHDLGKLCCAWMEWMNVAKKEWKAVILENINSPSSFMFVMGCGSGFLVDSLVTITQWILIDRMECYNHLFNNFPT